jgi:hypothetical protein
LSKEGPGGFASPLPRGGYRWGYDFLRQNLQGKCGGVRQEHVNGSKALEEVWAVESEVSLPQPIWLLTDTRLTVFKFSIHN